MNLCLMELRSQSRIALTVSMAAGLSLKCGLRRRISAGPEPRMLWSRTPG